MRSRSKTSMLTAAAVLAACALVLGFFERYIPMPVSVPGIKPGLSNIAVLFALEMLGAPYALAVIFLKVILSGFLYAGAGAIPYGLSGGVAAFLCMYAAHKSGRFSFTALSVLGGTAHNAGQLAVSALMLGSTAPFYYMPALLAAGSAAGLFTGFAAHLLVRSWRAAAVSRS